MADVPDDPDEAPLTVPPAVLAGISAALRSTPCTGGSAAHALRTRAHPARLLAAAAGLAAVVIAVGLGTAALVTAPAPTPSAPVTAEHITVSRPPAAIPLSDIEVLALLGRRPDYGPLGDPRRRASCLSGLGYPSSTTVLGAGAVTVNGHPGVLLVLPGPAPDTVAALAVAPNCSSADTGLLADRIVNRR